MSPKPGATITCRKGHFGKLFRVINQHVNKLGIPVGIIKSAALAMNLWLVMRGALSANVTETWRDYYLPSMTGIATLILG
jgi:hypothetical protein